MTVMLPRLYLIRHGEAIWSICCQHRGRTDILLTDQGKKDVRHRFVALRLERNYRVGSEPRVGKKAIMAQKRAIEGENEGGEILTERKR